MQDRTRDGRVIEALVVLDEFTRECLVIEVARRLRSDDVLAVLTDLFVRRGPARAPSLGQRARVHRPLGPRLARPGRGPDAVHRARQPMGERVLREPDRQAQGRAAEPRDLRYGARGADPDRALAPPLQRGATSLVPGLAPSSPRGDPAVAARHDHPGVASRSSFRPDELPCYITDGCVIGGWS